MVCLIDPVGDVYACPFAIHENFLAGNVRDPGGFAAVWRDSELFAGLRQPQTGGRLRSRVRRYDSCRGGCMAAKFFTGLPLDGPDPECVKGHGERALAAVGRGCRAQAVRQSFAPFPAGAGHHRPPPGWPRTSPAQTGSCLRREPAGRLPSLTGPGQGR